MPVTVGSPVAYDLAVGDARVPMNELIGKPVRFDFEGVIRCIHCDRKTKKSFSQGFCFPCFRKLAACDTCIMSPEKCHYHLGTCREPEWGETHCMVEHVVYLANSSGLKVGITRGSQVPTRWIDQGATDAIVFARVPNRYTAGLVEELLSPDLTDDFEMVHSTFEPHSQIGETVTRPTQEVGYLISGKLDLEIGPHAFTIHPGDSFRIRGEPFRWINPYDAPAIAIWVIAPPVY